MKKLPIFISMICINSLLLTSCLDEEDEERNAPYRGDIFENGDTRNSDSDIWGSQNPSRKSDTKTRAS